MAQFLPLVNAAASNPFLQELGAEVADMARRRVRSLSRGRTRSRTSSRAAPVTPNRDIELDEPGTSDSKRTTAIDDAYGSDTMCTLQIWNPTTISRSTGVDDLNTRESDTAVIKGFRLCMELANVNTTTPMYYNLALVVPRDNTSVSSTDFFRSQGGTSRSANFDPATLSAMELHCLPINTDRYVVLWHKRHRLEAGDVTSMGRDKKNIDFYTTIQKQIRFDDALSNPRKDIFLVGWASFFGRTAGTTAASGQNDTSETFRYALKVVTYFDDPANYLVKRSYSKPSKKRKFKKH